MNSIGTLDRLQAAVPPTRAAGEGEGYQRLSARKSRASTGRAWMGRKGRRG